MTFPIRSDPVAIVLAYAPTAWSITTIDIAENALQLMDQSKTLVGEAKQVVIPVNNRFDGARVHIASHSTVNGL